MHKYWHLGDILVISSPLSTIVSVGRNLLWVSATYLVFLWFLSRYLGILGSAIFVMARSRGLGCHGCKLLAQGVVCQVLKAYHGNKVSLAVLFNDLTSCESLSVSLYIVASWILITYSLYILLTDPQAAKVVFGLKCVFE